MAEKNVPGSEKEKPPLFDANLLCDDAACTWRSSMALSFASSCKPIYVLGVKLVCSNLLQRSDGSFRKSMPTREVFFEVKFHQ